jgi:hypothetical protein
MWVYLKTDTGDGWLYSVGYFMPQGEWVGVTDFENEVEAMARVHFLNGGNSAQPVLAADDPHREASP